jgi:hypothetical protein
MIERNQQLPQEPQAVLMKEPHKRRSDARYATTASRQAAYRARSQEKALGDLQLQLQGPVTAMKQGYERRTCRRYHQYKLARLIVHTYGM